MARTGAVANSAATDIDERQLASIGATRGADGWWYKGGKKLSHGEADKLVQAAGTAQTGLDEWGKNRDIWGRGSDLLSKAYGATPLSKIKIGGSVGGFLERNKADIAAGLGTVASGGNPLVGAAIKAGIQGAKHGATGLDAAKGFATGYGVGAGTNAVTGAANAAASQGFGAAAKAGGQAGLNVARDSVLGGTSGNTGANMAGIDWGKWINRGAKAIEIGGALIGANQARQDAKGAAGAASRAGQQVQNRYAERAPFRAMGQQRLTNPQQYDFSQDFTNPADAMFDEASGVQSRGLKSLETSPDRMAMIRQAMADFDATDAPRRQQGIRRIGQSAATLGRVGNEGVGTEIGNFELAAEGERNRMLSAMLREATEADVNDRFRRTSLAGDIAGQRFGFGQARIGNNAQRIAAERAARGQDFSEGMSLADLGYRGEGDAANVDMWNADRLDRSADANSGAVGQIAQSLGDAFGGRNAAPTFDPVAIRDAATFRPVRPNVPQGAQRGPAPSGPLNLPRRTLPPLNLQR